MSHELDPRPKNKKKNEERKVYGVSGMATLKKKKSGKKFRHAKRAGPVWRIICTHVDGVKCFFLCTPLSLSLSLLNTNDARVTQLL